MAQKKTYLVENSSLDVAGHDLHGQPKMVTYQVADVLSVLHLSTGVTIQATSRPTLTVSKREFEKVQRHLKSVKPPVTKS